MAEDFEEIGQVRERIARALYEAGAYCGNCSFEGWDSCAECRWTLLSYAVAVLDVLGHRPAATEEIEMLAAYSAALDEVYALRRALAFEASEVEAHTLDLKALGKKRRTQLAQAVERMRGAARGESAASYAEVNHRALDREMERAGGSNLLTRASWEASLIGSQQMPEPDGEIAAEQCGFCISGLVPAKQGEPPTSEPCPYCNGTGKQEPPS